LLRPLGNTIYLMPPYCTSSAEIASAFTTIGNIVEVLRGKSG
jgi:adenosylmethionine-8-amino-7-oxononanoate aminotransferase